ncbi:hypothetical protein BBO99_00007622 [Phytophthora kernoviae]|uniref:Uncharacterized protein n=2 Tax=Phytophthora kernoviae TaxID=325452 RepID=A0A3F2RHG8_9STRA|nr:hypothetical protein G195_008676 [Phytophthora kernoviae 00238/432]KAG2519076.1 hypothetical protein JM16_007292 [Phytophthora kernoviae]KAG2520274.1 hypothetical protein JM18_007174 [Phytophthora kernoviae]RLN02549.1 hypothetical protein BBI17_007571 [Phytophthora kernoviae]RLN48659.1 hypothetical protein BBJ29_006946 [Phytophthora kernoviae]
MHSARPSEQKLTLGVKGRLSNQEMEQLRSQLAQAAAYDHIPENQQAARAARSLTASKPMTKLYRRVASPNDNQGSVRPVRKTLASIQYDQKFSAKAYDSLKPRPSRGLSNNAKTILQDEYVTKPREVSCIPRNLSTTKTNDTPETSSNQPTNGKRRGPTVIPQVFIM